MIPKINIVRLFSLFLSGVITFAASRFHSSHRNLQVGKVNDVTVHKKIKKIKRVSYGDRNMKAIYKEDFFEQRKVSKITWKNVVVVILTYNDYESNKLVQAQFDTWIEKVGTGLDIVFVSDVDDVRHDDEIIPHKKDKMMPNIHLYRSNAKKEGKLARSKVMDAFLYVYKKFHSNNDKKFFLKLDPDSFVLPENLINFLDDLHSKTQNSPVDFGKGLCNNDYFCYSEGGLYGMNKEGFEKVIRYVSENIDIYNDFVPLRKNATKNVLIHEDCFTSYAFWKSTGYPMVWNNRIAMKSFFSDRSPDPISIHPVKSYLEFYTLEKIFYGSEGSRRDLTTSHKLLLEFSDSLDFVIFKWDSTLDRLVRK